MGFSRQEYWSGLPFPSPGNMQDSWFSRLWHLRVWYCSFHMEIRKYRTENNSCLVGDLQEHCKLTCGDSCMNKGFRHQEVCFNQPCPSLTLPLKMLYWNLSGSLGFGGPKAPILLAWPCNKHFSAPNSDISILSGLTVHRAHKLAFGNTFLTGKRKISFTTWREERPQVERKETLLTSTK